MSEHIVTTTFGELMERGVLEIGDGYRAKLEELGGNGPIFLRAGLLTERGFDWAAAERFHADLTTKLSPKFGYPGDTMVTTKGNSVGRAGFVLPGSPTFVYSPHLSYWRSLDSSKLAPSFLRYWSRSPEFSSQLHSMANSTDMAPYLSLADQRRLRVSLPSIGIQEAIADILGALDDKIAVNERTARGIDALLEVHFSADTQQIAQVARLSDVINLKYGKALTEGDRVPGKIPVFGGNGVSGSHNVPLNKGPGIIIGRKGANAGSVSWSQGPFWAIDTAFYVEPISNRIPVEFLFYLLQYAELRGLVGDSAIPGLNRDIALRCEVGLPADEVITRFSAMAKSILALSAQIADESRKLGKLRDALLPRLISGEIRVRM